MTIFRAFILLCVSAGAQGAGQSTAPASRPDSQGTPPIFPAIPLGTQQERPAPGQEPRVKFARTEHHFGEVDAGSTSTVSFEFVNEGKGPLKIYQLRPTCGCVLTSVVAAGKPYTLGTPIEAGVKGSIELTMNATWRGSEKKTFIDVLTNDPAFTPTTEAPFGHVKLHLAARIVRPIEVYSESGELSVDGRLEFGVFHYESPPKRAVELRGTKGQGFEVVGLTPGDARFQVRFNAVNPEKSIWKVEIEPAKNLPLGPFLLPLTVQARPDTPGILLFVTGQVRGALTIEPGLLQGLRLAVPREANKMPGAKLTLRSSGGPIAISDLRLAEPTDFKPEAGRFVAVPGKAPRDAPAKITENLTLESKLQDQGMTAIIELHVKPTMPEGFFNAILVFKTGVEGGPAELAIPVTGFGVPKSVK